MDTTFAAIEHSKSYYDFFEELLLHIKGRFACVESGVQGDAWIWIKQDGQFVAVDTFTAMHFEIKSDSENELLQAVIAAIQEKYPVRIYEVPSAPPAPEPRP